MAPEPQSYSAAQAILTRRSVQCSFSSIFHLQKAGMPAKDFQLLTKVFKGFVIVPLLVCGGAFVTYKIVHRNNN